MSDAAVTRILFVCLGNICRSPAAEAVFRHRAAVRGVLGRFEIDSAGTGGWHEGEPPDPRTQLVLRRHGVEPCGTARKVRGADFARFDLLVAMDRSNRADLLAAGAPPEAVRLLLDWHPEEPGGDVPDPYHGGAEGFLDMYRLVDRACERLLEDLLEGGLTRPSSNPSDRTR